MSDKHKIDGDSKITVGSARGDSLSGSKAINGADVAATLYTIIESCKKVGLDPKSFIEITVCKAVLNEDLLTPLENAKKIRSAEASAAS